MLKKLNKTRYILTLSALVLAAIIFIYTNQFSVLKLAFSHDDPVAISHYRLSQLSTQNFIDRIQASLEEKDIVEAQNLVTLAGRFDHHIPKELEEQTQESYFGTSLRYTKDFTTGFLTGGASSMYAIAGSLTSDYLGWGDYRDFTFQGTQYLLDKDYDLSVFSVAATGLAVSISSHVAKGSLVGAPVALILQPIDSGLSLIKSAIKKQKISKVLFNFIKNESIQIAKSSALFDFLKLEESFFTTPSPRVIAQAAMAVDFNEFLAGDFSSSYQMFSEINPIDLQKISNIFPDLLSDDTANELLDIARNLGELLISSDVVTTMSALEYADNASDIKKITSLSTVHKQKTSSILSMLGKHSFELGTLKYHLLSIIILIIIWLAAAIWLIYTVVKFVSSVKDESKIHYRAEPPKVE